MELNGRAPAEENYGVVEMGKNSQLSVLCMVKCWEWVGEVRLIQEIISALDTEGCKRVRG